MLCLGVTVWLMVSLGLQWVLYPTLADFQVCGDTGFNLSWFFKVGEKTYIDFPGSI